MFRKRKLTGNYGIEATIELEELMRKHMREWIVGGRALVIGSQGHGDSTVYLSGGVEGTDDRAPTLRKTNFRCLC